MAEAEFAAHGDPLNFIDDIYGCAIDPCGWPSVLRECATRVGGCAASILRISRDNRAVSEAQWSVDRKFERAIHTAAASMTSLAAFRQLRMTKPFAVSGWLGGADLSNSHRCLNNILPKHISDIAVVPLTREARLVSVLIVLRPKEAGAYLPDEIRAIAAVSPHFRRAAAISNLLDFKPLGEQRTVGSFNRMPMAFILTDGAGRILHANAAAAEILDGCPLLCLEDELAARDGRSDAALRSAIMDAAKTDRGAQGSRAKATSLIVTGPGPRTIEVWVMPLAERSSPTAIPASSARVAVFARAVDSVEQKTSAAEAACPRSAAAAGFRPRRAAASEKRLSAVLARASSDPVRPLSALSAMSIVRRADRLTKAAASTRAALP